MSVLKSITSSVLKDVTRSILRGNAERYFTTLVASGSMHYTIPTVTLTGDYKISSLVYFTGDLIGIYGNAAQFNSRTVIQADGRIDFRSDNVSPIQLMSSAGAVPVNNLSIVTVERSGSTGTITVNGSQVASGVVPTGDAVFNRIGSFGGSVFTNGIIANVNINDERFYPINENFATTTVLVDTISGQNGTAVAISVSDFYQLNDAGTIWLNQSGGSDLDIA